MVRTVVLGLVLLATAAQAAVQVRTGSWGYEYPGAYAIRPDGQTISLTGRRRFTFNGVIGSYWLGVYNCQTIPNYCPPNNYKLNWYSGSPYVPDDSKGVGLIGTVTLSGNTYKVGLPGGFHQLHVYVYGANGVFPPLGQDGKHVVQTYKRTFIGRLWHGRAFEWLDGTALVTVELEQEDHQWEIEAIHYDLLP